MSDDKKKNKVDLNSLAYTVLLRDRMAVNSNFTTADLNAELVAVAQAAGAALKEKK